MTAHSTGPQSSQTTPLTTNLRSRSNLQPSILPMVASQNLASHRKVHIGLSCWKFPSQLWSQSTKRTYSRSVSKAWLTRTWSNPMTKSYRHITANSITDIQLLPLNARVSLRNFFQNFRIWIFTRAADLAVGDMRYAFLDNWITYWLRLSTNIHPFRLAIRTIPSCLVLKPLTTLWMVLWSWL